jgi:hypothetical protein
MIASTEIKLRKPSGVRRAPYRPDASPGGQGFSEEMGNILALDFNSRNSLHTTFVDYVRLCLFGGCL